MSERLKENLPFDVITALNVFSSEELDLLNIWWSYETGEFLGVGFIDPVTQKATKFANRAKYEALLIIEDQIRLEISNGGSLV